MGAKQDRRLKGQAGGVDPVPWGYWGRIMSKKL